MAVAAATVMAVAVTAVVAAIHSESGFSTKQPVHSVGERQQYLLCHAVIARCTATIASHSSVAPVAAVVAVAATAVAVVAGATTATNRTT